MFGRKDKDDTYISAICKECKRYRLGTCLVPPESRSSSCLDWQPDWEKTIVHVVPSDENCVPVYEQSNNQIGEYNSFGEYLKTLPPDTVFRLWQYKRMFTPYEQDNKFMDESQYVNTTADEVRILDVINLPDGDLLLATTYAYGDGKCINYYKLSEISLAKCMGDEDED